MERFLNNLEDSLAEEQGFSTVGVALALLLSFALIFSAARVYEIESVSGDIQNVADSAALAAENVVGEYCVIATMCDAVVLSLSLSSLCALGLSVAAACTPPTAALSQALLKSAQKLKQARDSFSEKATSALEELKLMLPLVAAAKAANVIAENANARNGVAYRGLAILNPSKSTLPPRPMKPSQPSIRNGTSLSNLVLKQKKQRTRRTASRKKHIATIAAVRPTIACMNARRISHI